MRPTESVLVSAVVRALQAAAAVAIVVASPLSASGQALILKNGMQLQGSQGKVASVSAGQGANQAPGGGPNVKNIVVVDDALRRVFIPMYQVDRLSDGPPNSGEERFKIAQRVFEQGKTVVAVGPILRVQPFDDWGRRTLTMGTDRGNLDIIQGITDITPRLIRVQGLQSRNALVWDMRLATSSLPREQLSKILRNHIDSKNVDERKRIVQLYLQAERVQDARAELETIVRDFPDLKELQDLVRQLNQVGAQLLLKEIDRRRDAGQHGLAVNMLQNFPSDGVAGELLLKAREIVSQYDDLKKQSEAAVKRMRAFQGEIKDDKLRTAVGPICDEIAADLNIHNYERLADFSRLADDADLGPDQKVALAISGWLMGAGQGIENLAVASSQATVRNLIREFLRSKRKLDRDALLKEIRSEEAATPVYVAKILAAMRPPFDVDEADDKTPAVDVKDVAAVLGPKKDEAVVIPNNPKAVAPAEDKPSDQPVGLFTNTVPGLPEDPEIKYHVQLPPEYSPDRRYPMIITLNGAGTTPLQQVEWWAGNYNPEAKMRYGQAGRHGYIVVAPEWTREHQRKYEFSAREHAAVLFVLRDVSRRYSVDTDRVFLSGHSMGGDAAWDIGISHPDLWAGVIPIVASADKYILRYSRNAQQVPLYFVSGERDGNKREQNASEWDRYLGRPGYDVMVVEYLGRGHEHFFEEVQNIFEWMRLHTRNFAPKEFTCATMRPWDTFFFWVEVDKLPASATLVPADWAKAGEARAVETIGRVLENNGLSVTTGAGKVTVWLSPDIIDFNHPEKRPVVSIRGKRFHNLEPSVNVMLEDARSRGDRLHPFWGRIED